MLGIIVLAGLFVLPFAPALAAVDLPPDALMTGDEGPEHSRVILVAAKGPGPKPPPRAKPPLKKPAPGKTGNVGKPKPPGKNQTSKAIPTRPYKPVHVPGKKPQTWTSNRRFNSAENAAKHWKEKGSHFPQLKTQQQYVNHATSFLHNPPKNTISKTNHRGDIMRYHPPSNTFGVMSSKGVPRTLFKPTDGAAYWRTK